MTVRRPRRSGRGSGRYRKVPAAEWWRTEGTFYLLSEADRFREAPRAADFLERATGLRPGSRILDLACGYGRLAVELARRGHEVVGLDISKTLKVARQLSTRESLELDLIRGDLRRLNMPPVFDLVVLWGMSFGYFSDRENEEVLRRAVGCLRPGGHLVLDLHQRDWYLTHYLGEQVHLAPGGIVHDEVDFDPVTSRLQILSTLATGDGKVTARQFHSFREYSIPEMVALAGSAGLTDLHLHPNLSGVPGPVPLTVSNWQLVGATGRPLSRRKA